MPDWTSLLPKGTSIRDWITLVPEDIREDIRFQASFVDFMDIATDPLKTIYADGSMDFLLRSPITNRWYRFNVPKKNRLHRILTPEVVEFHKYYRDAIKILRYARDRRMQLIDLPTQEPDEAEDFGLNYTPTSLPKRFRRRL